MDQAEQLRKLVKQQSQPKNLARVFTVTSGKGGVGKSSISVNLAIQFSRLGKRVVIFDADFGLANIEVMLGIRPKYNLADLMFKGKSLKDIITPGIENINFVSGGSGVQELIKLTREQILYLSQKMLELDELADIIIIDTGAGISDAVLEFVISSSEVLLIATPEPTSITDAYALLKILHQKEGFSADRTTIHMVANRVNSDGEGNDIFNKISAVAGKFLDVNMQYLGAVVQDANVSKAIIQQKPISVIYPDSPATKGFEELAKKLCQDGKIERQQKKGITQIFIRLLKMRRNKQNK